MSQNPLERATNELEATLKLREESNCHTAYKNGFREAFNICQRILNEDNDPRFKSRFEMIPSSESKPCEPAPKRLEMKVTVDTPQNEKNIQQYLDDDDEPFADSGKYLFF